MNATVLYLSNLFLFGLWWAGILVNAQHTEVVCVNLLAESVN
jgi:hypothetical protein